MVKFFGEFRVIDAEMGWYKPIGGFAYYISPIRSIEEMYIDPLHTVTYILWMTVSCGLFAKMYISISGRSAEDISK